VAEQVHDLESVETLTGRRCTPQVVWLGSHLAATYGRCVQTRRVRQPGGGSVQRGLLHVRLDGKTVRAPETLMVTQFQLLAALAGPAQVLPRARRRWCCCSIFALVRLDVVAVADLGVSSISSDWAAWGPRYRSWSLAR
jgi:hypothetical protein